MSNGDGAIRALLEQWGASDYSVHDGSELELWRDQPILGDMVMIRRTRDEVPSGWTWLDNEWCCRVWTNGDLELREPYIRLRPGKR